MVRVATQKHPAAASGMVEDVGARSQLVGSGLPKISQRVYRIAIAANVEVAPIERTRARQILRENCNWTQDSLVIAFFGFLHAVKGLETLLPAFKQVLVTQPQARLLLIGGVESLALGGEDAKQYWVDTLRSKDTEILQST